MRAREAEASGIDVFLPKPVKFAELKKLLTVKNKEHGGKEEKSKDEKSKEEKIKEEKIKEKSKEEKALDV